MDLMSPEQEQSPSTVETQRWIPVTLGLSPETVMWIDSIRAQLGGRSRGIAIEQLLRELREQTTPSIRESRWAVGDWPNLIGRVARKLRLRRKTHP